MPHFYQIFCGINIEEVLLKAVTRSAIVIPQKIGKMWHCGGLGSAILDAMQWRKMPWLHLLCITENRHCATFKSADRTMDFFVLLPRDKTGLETFTIQVTHGKIQKFPTIEYSNLPQNQGCISIGWS